MILEVLEQLGEQLRQAVGREAERRGIVLEIPATFDWEFPREARFGDLSTNAAMVLAKDFRTAPRKLAEALAAHFSDERVERCEVAGPGFINLFFRPEFLLQVLRNIHQEGERYGTCRGFAGKKVLVEFVSANPTGPLHVGHARGAVVGDTLCHLLEATGYQATREYYFNDAGNQMNLLGESVRARYLQQLGREVPFPEQGYRGDYIVDIARALKAEAGDRYERTDTLQPFIEYATGKILKLIEADLDGLGIHFDSWVRETRFHQEGRVEQSIEALRERGFVYEKDGALFLKSTAFGDEEDRVIVKSNGSYTYLAPDIPYHQDKFDRGYDLLINFMGGDHASYVVRLKAALQALGLDAGRLHCLLLQMVRLKKGGEIIKLSTRAGDFLPLSQMLEELGKDVTRFFFLMRSVDAMMDFDWDLAKKHSMENPVYYVHNAHVRICSIFGKAPEKGLSTDLSGPLPLEKLQSPPERDILVKLLHYPLVVRKAAEQLAPHLVTVYLQELAKLFHGYYETQDVLVPDDPEGSHARLYFIEAVRQVLAGGLRLLGIEPMERM